jgi:hypothetical protein
MEDRSGEDQIPNAPAVVTAWHDAAPGSEIARCSY